jgi:outer membrane protein assembly factor BamB
MKIVVECSCQVPYEFDIEPVDGQMPGSVFCPTCGADGTEYANWVIQQALATEQDAKPKITLRHDQEETVVESRAPIESEEPTPVEFTEPAAEETPGLPKSCYLHKDQPVEAFCLTCKKPICLKCMKLSGYFCSPYCRSRAEQAGVDIPEYKGQDRLVRVRETRTAARISTAIILGLIALFIAYEWYNIFGQKPSVKFSMPIAGTEERLLRTQFISDHEVLVANSDKVSVYDFKKQQETWSKSLASYRPASPPRPTISEDEDNSPAKPAKVDTEETQRKLAEQMAAYQDYYDSADAKLRVVGNDLWVTVGRNIICLDRATGAEKAKTKVEGRIQEMTFADNAMTVVSLNGGYDYVLTRIALPSGTQQVEHRTVPAPPARPVRSFDYQMSQSDMDDALVIHEEHRFVAAGATVAGLDIKLVEKKVVSVEAMKAPNKDAFAGGVKVTQTKEFAEDVFNEMSRIRGGGTDRIDQSRYAVTIQRVFGSKEIAPWSGEVTGPPALFALPSVDLLVGSKTVCAFTKNDQKIWESTLTYPIAPQFQTRETLWTTRDFESSAAPCLERGDTLYFFDRGVLTAFDIKSGAARWRMPSVGIAKIQFDDKGMLYITTTSANPESIQYTQQVNLDKVNPIILKVDPANGKILWRAEKLGDECYLAGKYIYITMTRGGGGVLSLVRSTAPSSNFRLFRLNPKNGKQMWECYRSPGPSRVDFLQNQILFQFPDKLEVLKFLSL